MKSDSVGLVGAVGLAEQSSCFRYHVQNDKTMSTLWVSIFTNVTFHYLKYYLKLFCSSRRNNWSDFFVKQIIETERNELFSVSEFKFEFCLQNWNSNFDSQIAIDFEVLITNNWRKQLEFGHECHSSNNKKPSAATIITYSKDKHIIS